MTSFVYKVRGFAPFGVNFPDHHYVYETPS